MGKLYPAADVQGNCQATIITGAVWAAFNAVWKSDGNELSNASGTIRRVCPCYRLPQFVPDSSLASHRRLPVCAALNPAIHISREQASRLCRSGEFPSCDRFRTALPDWDMAKSPAYSGRSQPAADADEFRKQLISSAAWVIGIPTAITFLIMLAIWITENVWMPTESILYSLVR
jgi:hypothetical protein